MARDTNTERDKARECFWRFGEVLTERGHEDWMRHAKRLSDLYKGGGRMWRPEHRAALEADGRPCREVNTIFPAVNAAVGMQISGRVDIGYMPKGGRATEDGAKIMSKVTKHVLDNTGYRYVETTAFNEGLVKQRGYLDIRMDYEDSINGEVKITSPDAYDVIPDPDGKTYNPDGWSDVHVMRWLTLREIEGLHGKDAMELVKASFHTYCDEEQWGSNVIDRSGFGNDMPASYSMGRGWYGQNDYTRRYRLIDKQYHEYSNALVAVFPGGDFRIVEGYPREHMAWLLDHGVHLVKKRVRRVRWMVCAPEVCLYDDFSPYEHFTIVPFFPYFDRGQTLGMVDNMVSPAESLNKQVSQFEHIVNGSANGGWQGEADALENMSDDEFVANAAQNNLVLLRKPNTQPFTRIQPNPVPQGLDKMIDMMHNHLNIVSGIDPNGMQIDRSDMSGIALQSLQYAQQQKIAIVMDNLSQTRHMVAGRTANLIQRYMGNERVIRITEVDDYGVEQHTPLALNVRQQDGTILNDLTAGEYDYTVAEKPANITFNNTEFEQMKAMRKDMGIAIPDPVVIRASNLADKHEIAEAMRAQQGQPDPRAEAEAALTLANQRLAEARTVGENIKALYAAIQTAQVITVTPQSAAIADKIAKSAGFTDADLPPIYPQDAAAPVVDTAAPGDTTPLTPSAPASPNVGINAGMTDSPINPPQ